MERLTQDEVRGHVAAPAQVVYDLVTEMRRTPEWSPEVVECRWLDGSAGADVGARFRATNRRRWFSWSNEPVVEVADAPREFGFARSERGAGTVRWYYRMDPTDDGTSVAAGYEVLRPVPLALHVILRMLFGVRDLRADLHANMQASLERLTAIAESEAQRATRPCERPRCL
jgi:hypothetical protein